MQQGVHYTFWKAIEKKRFVLMSILAYMYSIFYGILQANEPKVSLYTATMVDNNGKEENI